MPGEASSSEAIAAGPATAAAAHAAAERAARGSYSRLLSVLAVRTRDIAAAEDALAEAFAAALARWPEAGVPANPEGWLVTVARRRLLDEARRGAGHERHARDLALVLEEMAREAGQGARDPAHIPDERLRLMFACAHPAIDRAVRSPLILQVILGFEAADIAGLWLVPPATMGQRLVRAKAKIRLAGIALAVPEPPDMPERLAAVLEAIYAVCTDGWSDPAGLDGRRRDLAGEAIWLGRLVAGLLPDEPEAQGLLSLMLHLEARRPARRDATGAFVPLHAQDPARWDAALIDEAEALLQAASLRGRIGRYQLEAAIQSAHAVRRHGREPDWPVLETLYDALLALTGSPVVALNRAMVLAMTREPEAALALVEALGEDPRMEAYQPWWAARADLLSRCGQAGEACVAWERAIALEREPGVRRYLQERAGEG